MKVLVLTGHDWALLNYRGPLLRAMVAAGHEVLAAAPAENPAVIAQFSALGIRFVPVPLARAGLNPVRDLYSLVALRKMLRREQPDVLLSYAIKSVIYGSIAARWAGVPHIYALIVGLGASFHTAGLKGRMLRRLAIQMYRMGCSCCERVFVQNPEIRDLFGREGIAAVEKVTVVAGSGVDTQYFPCSPVPSGPPVFLYVGRLLRDKGVGEFIEAARRVKPQLRDARFVLVGDTDRNPASFSSAQVDAWRRKGLVEAHGFAEDVRPYLHACTIFVLPSYHEGVPRSVLEAMAVGRAIITTDTIGCRETIREPASGEVIFPGVQRGRNGLLVPVRASEPLAAAMLWLANRPDVSKAMARESRALAETVFDVRNVNQMMLSGMRLARS